MILKEKERSVRSSDTREKLCGKVWKIRRTGQRPGA